MPLGLKDVHNNLDLFCAQYGQAIVRVVMETKSDKTADKAAKETENLITRLLGVLQAQGIYATFLLLASRQEKAETALSKSLVALINDAIQQDLGTDPIVALVNTESILADLPTLLLVKRIMEQSLIYARYHAKARGQEAQDAQAKAGVADASK